MAKGVTNAPLVVWVWHEWYSRPEILGLMRQGHVVVDIARLMDPVAMGGAIAPNLIIHPAAGWVEELFDYIPAALTRARARRRAK